MLNKAAFDVPDFFDRGLLRSPWFWCGCVSVVSVVAMAIVVAGRRNLLVADPFRCLQLLAAVFAVLAEAYASLNSYLTIRALAVDWRATGNDPSVYFVAECAARSIQRSPLVCAAAAVLAIAALR